MSKVVFQERLAKLIQILDTTPFRNQEFQSAYLNFRVHVNALDRSVFKIEIHHIQHNLDRIYKDFQSHEENILITHCKNFLQSFQNQFNDRKELKIVLPRRIVRKRDIYLFIGKFSPFGFILSPTRKVYVFGMNGSYQLGLNHADECLEAILHPYFEENKKFNLVKGSGGWNHCVLLSDEGVILVCGSNSSQKIGLGKTVVVKVPTKMDISFIDDSDEIVDIECGNSSSFAITSSRKVYATGARNEGQLGIPSDELRGASAMKRVGGIPAIHSIATGDEHTFFLSVFGRVFGSGTGQNRHDGGKGRLGMENTMVPVALEVSNNIFERIVKVEVGKCYSVFLTENKELYGCGGNNNGELGLGLEKDIVKPKMIRDRSAGIVDVKAGNRHLIYLNNEGVLVGTGDGGFGQLANRIDSVSNDKRKKFEPLELTKGKKVKYFHVGCSMTMIIDREMNCWACGDNSVGSFFNGEEKASTELTLAGPKLFPKLKKEFIKWEKMERIEFLREKFRIIEVLIK